MNVAIIVNPIAGCGKGREAGQRLLLAFKNKGLQATLHETQQGGDGKRFAQTLDADVLIAVGGDGTFCEVLNGVADLEKVTLGMFPLGTANVLAKELHLTNEPETLAEWIYQGSSVTMDVVDTGGNNRFILMASAGFDAGVIHTLAQRRGGPIHMAGYLRHGLATLKRYSCPALRVVVDGKQVSASATQVVVANAAAYGGPLKMIQSAKYDDGLLHVICCHPRGRIRMLWLFLCAVFKHVEHLPGVNVYVGKRIKIESHGASCPVQIDGEPSGFTPVTFQIASTRARVVAPSQV